MDDSKTLTSSLLHFPLSLLSLFFSANISLAANSLSQNQSLAGKQKLTSQGGDFELGFFRPGKSPYYYLGIWYSLDKVSQFTSVWVANREAPIADPATAELKISADGNLVLSNQSNPQIWTTNMTTITSDSTVIIILINSGNLVLRPKSDSNVTLWQSFDHPTDTWLPGAKLGLNKVTLRFQRLVSWKNVDDPAPGIFTLQIDPSVANQFLLIYNSSFYYWTSGTWNGQFFSLIPELTAFSSLVGKYGFNFQYVSNAVENYFIYSYKSDIFCRLILDVSGQVKESSWMQSSIQWLLFKALSKSECQVHALCGPFGSCNEDASPSCNCIKGFREKSPSDWDLSDRTGGCVRNTPLQCGDNSSTRTEKDRFYTMPVFRMPINARNLQVSGASECELSCLNNCSCTAYSYGSTRCSVWYGDLLNLQDQNGESGGGKLFIRLAASELPYPKSKNRVVIGSVIGVVGSLALLVVVWLLIWQRRRRRRISPKSKVVEGVLVAFSYSDMRRATKKFSEKLGEGSFGSVFKGILPDSTVIAVKKLKGLRQGEKQFRTEVSTIGTIHHVNLVRLYGFCSHKIHKLLVYEYMPCGSLDTQLFRKAPAKALDWTTRYQIALGTARGLAYLHEQCRDRIIHCDVKPENILLDASFVPKVADFGLAKLVSRDFSRVLTTMRGTRGYLAPEWISGVAITSKADVYSYGMILFEIISGKRNSDWSEENKSVYFPTLAASKLIEGDIMSSLDRRLGGVAKLEEVVRACKIACWCIQDDENSRPSMGKVVQILEGAIEVNMPPIPRVLQIFADNQGKMAFFSDLSSDHSSKTHGKTESKPSLGSID